ncbi:MAG: hypothetical protein HZA11_13940, partial [Nitrospirae bacterium]|nr:hypothetical protein [Nitrospirota bacterium]
MGSLKHRLLYTAVGASSGLTGLASFSRCSGNVCTSCFGCVGVLGGILFIVLIKKIRLFQSCHSRENGNPDLSLQKQGTEGTGFRVKHGMTKGAGMQE